MKKAVKSAVIYLFTGLLLWYLFRGTDWKAVFDDVMDAQWGWLAAATALILCSFLLRVQRWSYIVRTAKPVPYRSLFSATQIGFLGNFTLPGRLGEVIRAMVLSRLAALPFPKCFAFVVLDRVSDLVGLIIVMLVTIAAFRPAEDIVLPAEIWAKPIPKDWVLNSAMVTGAVLVGIVAAFVLLYLNQGLALRISGAVSRFAGRFAAALLEALSRVTPGPRLHLWAERARGIDAPVHRIVQHFADGLHVFRSAKDVSKTLAFTLLTWGSGLLSYVCIAAAFGLGEVMPWYTGFMVMTLLTLFISVPGPPGFVGTFHAGIVVALVIVKPDIDLDTAKAVAIIAHLLNLISVVVVGLYCLRREGLGLVALRPPKE